MNKNKIIAAVIALVAVCIASFVAVRQLVKGERIDNPVIKAETSSQTQPTSAPISVPQDTTTEPTETTTEKEEPASSDNPFTTYNIPTSVSEIPTSSITTTTLPFTSTTAQKPQSTTTDPNILQAALQNDGFLDYKYNETGNYYYTNEDPWQRMFGFNAAYDFGAQFVYMFFDTARIKFPYENKDWMIEFWKGQYGAVFIGAEIGVYYKPQDRTVEHYDSASDDDAIYMEMSLYRNGDELLSREYTRYWWCTGFVPGKLKKYSDRSELNLKARITMDNKKMLKAFVGGLESCKEFDFVEGKNYRIDGLDVFINW